MFRAARENQGLTQYQLAELTEGSGSVSRATISGIERGASLPGLEVLLALSRVLHLKPVEILEWMDASMTVPVDVSGLSMEELRGRAEQFFWAGRYRRALSVYDAMLELLILDPPGEQEKKRLTARLEVNRAVTLRQCSALNASEAAAKRAVRLSEGFDELQADAYMVLASLHSHEGNSVLAEVMAEQAVKLSESCGDKVRGLAWCQKGVILHRAERFEAALEACVQAREYSTAAKDHRNLIIIEGSIGSCLVGMGKRTTAQKQFVMAIELSRKHQDPAAESSRLVELGRLSLAEGNHEEADRLARAALRIARPAERWLTVFRAEWLRNLVTTAKGPEATDRHRLAYLKKLYPRVKGHRTADAVCEFERDVLSQGSDHE